MAVTEIVATPSRRQASRLSRIQATRARVLGPAAKLFVHQGYLATTMGEIASASGVAVQTLYLRFGGKADLIRACYDVAVAGDDEPVVVADRPWVEELRREPDLSLALKLLVSSARVILERTVPLFRAIERAAADPEVAELLSDLKRQKLEMVEVLAQILRAKADFNAGVSLERATDLIYALGSEELFAVLCVDRGWSGEEWEEFVYSSNMQTFS